MANINKIKVGSTTYDIAPESLTDSTATYVVSCPTLTANTTIEVASNKTTTLSASSTDTQYPSAKAVYDAVQSAVTPGSFTPGTPPTGVTPTDLTANTTYKLGRGYFASDAYYKAPAGQSDPGTIASNITTVAVGSGVPIVSATGLINATDASAITIPAGKTLTTFTNRGSITNGSNPGFDNESGATINVAYNFGTITSLVNQTGGTITGLTNADGGTIAGMTNMGTFTLLTNNSGKTIGTIDNIGTISSLYGTGSVTTPSGKSLNTYTNAGTISMLINSGTVGSASNNTGTIYMNHSTSGKGNMYIKPYAATFGGSGQWHCITNGLATPFVEVSDASTLAGYLVAANKGILFKYTGTTTTVSSVTYTNGNVYTYQA